MIKDLIEKTRSYRRFEEYKRIDEKTLISFVENAIKTPSGSNLQPLKYKVITERNDNEELFKYLKWAGYLKDWDGPKESERPSGYIIILGDLSVSKNFSVDLGISSYALMLSASEIDIGSCMIGSINRDAIRDTFNIPEQFEVLLVIAFGYPAEKIILEKVVGNSTKYYRDERDSHHVPKREIDDVLIV